jgi:hypothetical protein
MYVMVQEVWFLMDRTQATNSFLSNIVFFQDAMPCVQYLVPSVSQESATAILRISSLIVLFKLFTSSTHSGHAPPVVTPGFMIR